MVFDFHTTPSADEKLPTMSAYIEIKILEYRSIEVCETRATSRNALFQFFFLHNPSIWERAASDIYVERGFPLKEDDYIGPLRILNIKDNDVCICSNIVSHASFIKSFGGSYPLYQVSNSAIVILLSFC